LLLFSLLACDTFMAYRLVFKRNTALVHTDTAQAATKNVALAKEAV
jgi:hypothetical protein